PVGPAPAEAVAVGVEAGWTVDGGWGEGTDRLRTGEQADTTDAASQSTTTVRARIAIGRQPVTTSSGSSPVVSRALPVDQIPFPDCPRATADRPGHWGERPFRG